MQYIKLHFREQYAETLLIDAYREGTNIAIEMRGLIYLFRVRAIDTEQRCAIVTSVDFDGVGPQPQLVARLVGRVGWVAMPLRN